jgi:branched-chain amino acid transport system permease protein
METLFCQVSSGLATGAIYASLALALVMIYQTTHLVNFAQGELATCSAYLAYALLDFGLPYGIAVGITVVASFAAGLAIERFAIRPVARGPVLPIIIVFIGLMLIANSLTGWIFGYSIKTFPSPFPEKALFGNTYIGAHELGVIAVVSAVVLLLYGFIRYTSVGLALRAVAANPESSRLVGIRAEWMLGLGWGLAAGVGAIAGIMIAPIVFLDPHMMSGVLLYAFAAALVGGIDSPGGAVIGGVIVGVVENLAGAYLIGTELKLTVALMLVIGVLLVRPAGLFGKVVVARV